MNRLRNLVDSSWLHARIGDADLRIFDCTTQLGPAPPDSKAPYEVISGRADYEAAHIPGAGFLDLQGELSDPESPLLFTVPSADRFAEAMSRHGVGEGTFVVLYSAGTMAWATRVWWLLRLFGFDKAAVLDGGWERWRADDHPVSQAAAAYPPARFVARPRSDMLATRNDVLSTLDESSHVLVNTLPVELFLGDEPSRYGRPGRIPGSKSIPYSTLVDPDSGAFLPADACETILADALGADAAPLITYCGGGITATLLNFVLAGLDRDSGGLYDGSLSEWAPDESLPLERG